MGMEEGCRIVVHIDLDCFFVQVEQRKDPSLKNLPVAVQQHDDIICVSYEARKLGIRKKMLPTLALEKLPSLQLVHVPKLYGTKVSYLHYKQASNQVFQILKKYCAVVERASIDEAYLDITDYCLQQLPKFDVSQIEWEGYVFGGEPVGDISSDLVLFRIADRYIAQLRAHIKKELGFSCSAGISSNKLLSKLSSSLNKPDQQTIVPHQVAVEFIRSCAVEKVLTLLRIDSETIDKAKSTGADVAGELVPSGFLSAAATKAIMKAVDPRPVLPFSPPKSLSTSMSLTPITDINAVKKVVSFIATELRDVIREDQRTYNRKPQKFSFGFRCVNEKETSKMFPTSAIPTDKNGFVVFSIVDYCVNLFEEDRKLQKTKDWSLRWINLTCTKFVELATNSIASYFSSPNKTKTKPTARLELLQPKKQKLDTTTKLSPTTLPNNNKNLKQKIVSPTKKKRRKPPKVALKNKQKSLTSFFAPKKKN